MKLFTEELKKEFPEIGSQEEIDDPIVPVKFFCPWNQWTWYPYEFDGKDIFYGYVKGDYNEFGTFSLSEMEAVNGPMGLRIERDLYWEPRPLSQCK